MPDSRDIINVNLIIILQNYITAGFSRIQDVKDAWIKEEKERREPQKVSKSN